MSYSSVYRNNHLKNLLEKNENLCQKVKPFINERASYCIQFETGTKFILIFKFNKLSQSSEKNIIDISEWIDLENENVREVRKKTGYAKVSCEKKERAFLIQKQKNLLNCRSGIRKYISLAYFRTFTTNYYF